MPSLQWSRFFSKRKIVQRSLRQITRGGASMEPLFFKAENAKMKKSNIPMATELQWSRFFSKRKIWLVTHCVKTRAPAFNGAAFFQSGKSCLLGAGEAEVLTPSMEPLFFKAENAGAWRRIRLNVTHSFNGAAFFQSGKSLHRRQVVHRVSNPSMEPLFFKAENLIPSGCFTRH